jgi:Bifunctional DNA primase/polymerase, N-terminal
MGVWRMKTPPFLDFALSYAREGFAVFPCKPRGKEPITKHGFKDASRDEAQIRKWWTRAPNANIGIATGARSGLIVVDIDSLEGAKLLLKLTERFGALTPTHRVVTRKGCHFYFKLPPNCGAVPSSKGGGLDIRADRGYVITPPSIHPDGGSYKWDCASPDEMAMAPQWLLAFAGDRDGVLKVASPADGLADPPSVQRQRDGAARPPPKARETNSRAMALSPRAPSRGQRRGWRACDPHSPQSPLWTVMSG